MEAPAFQPDATWNHLQATMIPPRQNHFCSKQTTSTKIFMSCRTGPLRVARPLRGVYTGLGMISGRGPPVGRDDLSSDQREDLCSILPRQVKKACERPPHAQWARPAGHVSFNSVYKSAEPTITPQQKASPAHPPDSTSPTPAKSPYSAHPAP